MARHGLVIDGLKVARAREALGGDKVHVTQAAFAERIGVHPVTMNRIENGKAKVSLETLERIAEETGYSRDHFLSDDEDEEAARMRSASEAEIHEALDLAEALRLLIRRELKQKDRVA